jgi:hypothetical protein
LASGLMCQQRRSLPECAAASLFGWWPGFYTDDVTSDPAAAVAREWHAIAGRMFPRAVITDRSAITRGPVESVLCLSHDVVDVGLICRA